MKFIFFNYSFRTGEEKKVFVNAIKEAKKLNKLSSSIPVLGKNQHYRRTNSTGPITETKDGSNDKKPRLKKKPSFGKKDNKKKPAVGLQSPRLQRISGKFFGKSE